MLIVFGVILFFVVFSLGVVVGALLKKSHVARELRNTIVDVLERNEKAEILHTMTDEEEARVDNHRKAAKDGVILDI